MRNLIMAGPLANYGVIINGRTSHTRKSLRKLSMLGLALVVLGAGGLRLGHFSYFNMVPAVNAGPIHLDAHMERRASIPTVAGALVLMAGLGFIIVGRRTA